MVEFEDAQFEPIKLTLGGFVYLEQDGATIVMGRETAERLGAALSRPSPITGEEVRETDSGRVPAETWRSTPEINPYYVVSDLGRVRNVDTGKLLFGEVDRDGYRRVNLVVRGHRLKRRVHRLVCEAFHGPPPEGHEVAHLDGDKRHNAARNLAWVTRSENIKHQVVHGTHQANPKRGADHPQAKLSAEQVAKIRQLFAEGRSGRALAAQFGIGSSHCSKIIRGASWKIT